MLVSIEVLYHVRCELCDAVANDSWFSKGDPKKPIELGAELFCPTCGVKSAVTTFLNGKREPILGLHFIHPPTEHDPKTTSAS